MGNPLSDDIRRKLAPLSESARIQRRRGRECGFCLAFHGTAVYPIALRNMRAIMTIFALLVLPIPVLAHEHWISRRQIRETAGGFLVGGMYFITRERVLPSGDESYWACFADGGTGAHDHEPGIRCFFVPLST